MKNLGLPRSSGIYLVTLTNTEPLSVKADRPRIADRCIKVTSENCKVGKANNLAARKRNYEKTFGAHHVRFEVLAIISSPDRAELAILDKLMPYRIRGSAGRLNEWLQGITAEEVRLVVGDILKDGNYVASDRAIAVVTTPGNRAQASERSSSLKEAATDGCDPAETVRLLALLRKSGFTDKHFSIVHHFPTEKIESHLRYCRKTIQFRPRKQQYQGPEPPPPHC